MNWKSHNSSVLSFLPLLVLYIAVVLVFSSNVLEGDEFRHLHYAENLIHGFYTEADNPELLNGPGYPLVLAPFLAINSGFLILKLLNAIFVFIGVVYFKKTIEFFAKKKYAIIFAFLVGIYPPLLRYMPLIYSEPLTFMIVCGLLFHVFKLFRSEKLNRKQIVIISLYIVFLVLVKIIFLQVIGLSLLILIVLFLWNRDRQNIKIALVLVGGFLLIVPYLMYAYSLTGKLFYLGTGGGEILYHRSTPYENEWGNWFSREDVLHGNSEDFKPDTVYENLNQLSVNHRKIYVELEDLTFIERDSAFKAIAIENMKAHPGKYLKNTISNVGRFLFHYPFSYRNQNMAAYGYLIPNALILGLCILCIYPFLLNRRNVPFELKAVMIFYLIYACAIILLDGRGRNFIIMVPSLVLFFAYIYTNTVKITLLKPREEKQQTNID
ncbi:hypothetical protein [Maribacter arenosus]|uniref:Dolichyl-phosphate-mannose-protein mannosyltransferase n=1 Tax=Maribacter arenosus TaxID=1854708 RepID=A0ABR7VI65_9FLAO|nr:hypothetical protein [Maribacter arenosus]MBD0852600.1 hypothetical protein [Maribacter arenosus]